MPSPKSTTACRPLPLAAVCCARTPKNSAAASTRITAKDQVLFIHGFRPLEPEAFSGALRVLMQRSRWQPLPAMRPNTVKSATALPPRRFAPWTPPGHLTCCEQAGDHRAVSLQHLGVGVDLQAAHGVVHTCGDLDGIVRERYPACLQSWCGQSRGRSWPQHSRSKSSWSRQKQPHQRPLPCPASS